MKRILWLLLLSLGLASCIPGQTSPGPPPGASATSIYTEDGVRLRGYLFGSGDVAIILTHMASADQRSWFDFASRLAQKGYLVLTFDFRGFGESGGLRQTPLLDQDLSTALRLMRTKAQKVFLIGASMGGTAALKAAARTEVAGVVTLSAPVAFQGLDATENIPKVKAPKLFLASEGDGAAASNARYLQEKAQEPKTLRLFPGEAHGSDLLRGRRATEVEEEITRFLERLR